MNAVLTAEFVPIKSWPAGASWISSYFPGHAERAEAVKNHTISAEDAWKFAQDIQAENRRFAEMEPSSRGVH